MFEKFSQNARTVVIRAQEDADERRSDRIGTEHLLHAVLADPDSLAATALTEFGVDQAGVEAEIARRNPGLPDAEALATLGIDLEEVRRRTAEAFGPGALDSTSAATARNARPRRGHIPFDEATKKVLELALREAVRLRHNYVGTEHILLGMLHPEAEAAHDILEGRGVRLEEARLAIAEHLARGEQAS